MNCVELMIGEVVAALGNKGSSHGVDDRGLSLLDVVAKAPRSRIKVSEVFSKV
jgi:hypothetical protein